MVTDLVAFLRARLVDDERTARAALHEYGPWEWHDGEDDYDHIGDPLIDDRTGMYEVEVFPERGGSTSIARMWDHLGNAQHIARFDPARVLAEVAAKRAILARHDDTHDCGDPRSWELPYVGCSDLRSLAQPFRDHPDFDPAWTEET